MIEVAQPYVIIAPFYDFAARQVLKASWMKNQRKRWVSLLADENPAGPIAQSGKDPVLRPHRGPVGCGYTA